LSDEHSALPTAARGAWAAYKRMVTSKAAHYGYLETLETKVQNGGMRSLAESARLETLLADHDRCVATFAAAIKQLGNDSPEARDALIDLMKDNPPADAGTTH